MPPMTQDQAEHLDAIRRMVEAMRRHPPGSPAAILLDNFLGNGRAFDACDLLLDLVRRVHAPVVLAFDMPGYVTLGHVGNVVILQEPPSVDGLRIAWDVFLHGLAAPAVLRTEDWGKGPRAAYNAVRRAADWVDRHCPTLATAMRQISFSDDGRPAYKPANPIEVRVFSAYSMPHIP